MELSAGSALGRLEFDDTEGVLRRDGRPVPLRPLATAALAILVRRRGRLVTREELRRELWGDTVVDWDGGLNQAMSQVRRALGDDAREPELLETVPRRGYRLRAPRETRRPRMAARRRDLLTGAGIGMAIPILVILLCAALAGS